MIASDDKYSTFYIYGRMFFGSRDHSAGPECPYAFWSYTCGMAVGID